jgi:hypothetical protein
VDIDPFQIVKQNLGTQLDVFGYPKIDCDLLLRNAGIAGYSIYFENLLVTQQLPTSVSSVTMIRGLDFPFQENN